VSELKQVKFGARGTEHASTFTASQKADAKAARGTAEHPRGVQTQVKDEHVRPSARVQAALALCSAPRLKKEGEAKQAHLGRRRARQALKKKARSSSAPAGSRPAPRAADFTAERWTL
jgi:hypothetical protein